MRVGPWHLQNINQISKVKKNALPKEELVLVIAILTLTVAVLVSVIVLASVVANINVKAYPITTTMRVILSNPNRCRLDSLEGLSWVIHPSTSFVVRYKRFFSIFPTL